MYFLSRLSIYLYVFMFYPVIVSMFLNKKARRNTVLYVIFLNTILISLFTFLSNRITFDGLVIPTIILIIIMTAIFVISGIILQFKTPKIIQEYDAVIDTSIRNKEDVNVREIKLIRKTIKNWNLVCCILLVLFIFSLLFFIYFLFLHRINGIEPGLVTWVVILVGANYFSWKFSRDSLNKLAKSNSVRR